VAQKSSSKVLVSIFWGNYGILLVGYLEIYANIAAKYYAALLDNLKQQLHSKRGCHLSKGMFFKIMLLFTKRQLRTENWQIFALNF
jgi:hypothetical protein